MQNVTRRQLMPAVGLTCVTTDKFKTGLITVNFITRLSRETAAKNALLPRVLRRGTALHPDMDSISRLLDELYGAVVEPVVRKKGELQCVGLCADFIDDDFVPQGERVLEHICDLLGEMLLAPATHGGLLLGKYVESEKKNLIDDIRAGINDKRRYALDRLISEMCSGEAYGANRLGTEEDAAAINALSLTKHYRTLLESSRIEIFYCGGADEQRVESALSYALAALPRRGSPPPCDTEIVLHPPEAEPRTVTDTLDVSQGKMTVGFRMGDAMKAPDYPALLVFNALYGGAVTSKLFMNVRERLSLCYYASSMLEKHKGVLLVSSGVEPENFGKALGEILAQLDAVKAGDISDWEFTSAKRAVITSVRAAMDRPLGLEDLFFDSAILGMDFSPAELAALCDGVTPGDVVRAAADVKLDTVYYLKGTEAAEVETKEL